MFKNLWQTTHGRWSLIFFMLGVSTLGWYLAPLEADPLIVERLNARMDQTPEPSATVLETTGFSGLTVQWHSEPVELDPKALGLPASFRPYIVGTVNSEPFKGDRLFLIERQCDEPCRPLHYRVIDDRARQGLILLSRLSGEPLPGDEELFLRAGTYDIAELRLPERLSVQWDNLLLQFQAEPVSPAALFKYFPDNKIPLDESLKHARYGTLYENLKDGYFIVRRADHTVRLYRLAGPLPFFTNIVIGPYMEAADLTLKFSDGTEFESSYTPMAQGLCTPLAYTVHRGLEKRLRKAGTLGPELAFYEPFEDDELYKPLFPEGKVQMQEHPIVFFKDGLGRWVQLTSLQFYKGVGEISCPFAPSAI